MRATGTFIDLLPQTEQAGDCAEARAAWQRPRVLVIAAGAAETGSTIAGDFMEAVS